MFRTSGKVVLFLLFLFLVRRETAVAQVSQSAPDIRVLDSSEQGITVEFIPHYFPLKKDTVKGKVYDVVQFERGLSFDYGFAGKPDVRYRSVLIGLPGRNGNRITILQSDFETMTGISLETIPSFSPAKEEQKNSFDQVNNGSEIFPLNIASLTNIGIVDGIFVGTIALCPLQYEHTAHTLKKYSRIVFRVDYGSPEGVQSHAGTVEWEKSALVNGQMMEKLSAARPPLAKTAQVNSVLANGKWVKLEIQSDGMYKIDASYLRTIGMDAAVGGPFSSIKIFGNNGRVLPPDLNVPRPADLTQFPVLDVDNNSNGNLDADDYILFYAPGVTGWNYSPTQKTYSHYINPYTNSNYCFIEYLPGGTQATMQSVAVNGSVGGDVTTAVGKVFFHEEKTNVTHSGLEWYSSPFDAVVATTRVISNKLDGYIAGSPVTYKYELLSRADVSSSFTLTESDNLLTTVSIPAMPDYVLNDPAGVYEYSSTGQATTVPNLVDQRSNLKLVYRADSKAAIGWIYWIEILYTQQLVPVNDELLFTSPDTSGTIEYNLSGFSSSNVSIFDVTDVFNVRSLAVTEAQEAGRFLFKDTLSSGLIKKYWAGTSAAYKTPASFTAIPNSNLRGTTPGADFVIITHHDFLTQAQQLRDYKQNLPGGDALRTIVVEVDTLYNEFGDGMPDPTAIRDFLKYATTQWQVPPKYVLFFGDACFDYKNILGLDKNWVPTYETATTRDQINTFGYDDYFCSLDPLNSTTVSLAHGRLAVRTPAKAQLVVDKIMQYETKPSHGSWQDVVTIVADDGYVNDAIYNETEHTAQAEDLATIYTPQAFDVKKIYEVDYPTVIDATGHRKPAARQAILDQVNRGTLMLNFTGHGNPTVWAHEYILTQSDVNTQFFNADKLAFVCAATCDWGRFDDAGAQSSAEDVITNPNGGAIGVLSADRAVYSYDNAQLNYKFYSYIFPTDPYQRTPRLGDALMLAKNTDNGSSINNKRKYHLFADPTLRLAVPQLVMSIDSINGASLSQTQSDTLKALEKVTIKGAVRDNNGSVLTGINGTALVTVFDAERNRHIIDYGYAYDFVQAGGIIYKGEDTVRNGQLSATFIIPKDISYENKNGKLSVYFSTPTSDGRGYTENVVIGGTSNDTIADTQGPSIKIYLDNDSFHSGDLVDENPVLYVELSDSSGINTSTSGIGHGLTAWLDDSAKGIDLSDYYTGKKDSYQEGVVQYQLSGLAPGRHTLQVKAWNVYNYSSSENVEFTVAPSTTLSLQNVYNIPNPVTVAKTTFTFQQNQLTPIDVHIKIYTIAGRLVQTIDRYAVADRFVEIPWDCRDRDGDLLGNGIYLYKVMASTIDGSMTSEALGKLAIVR
jgi:hypothetical protein